MLTGETNAASVFCNKSQCLSPCLTHTTSHPSTVPQAGQHTNNNNNNNNVAHNNNSASNNHHHQSPHQQQPHAARASPEQCSHSRRLHTLLLEFLDVFLSCGIVAPCVIAYWRGTWELMGVLIFPSNGLLSASMSFLIGGLGHLLFTLLQFFLRNHIHPDKRRLTYYVISRLYTAVFGVVCVNMWRGSWVLCDILTSADSLLIICVVTFVALLFLTATRTVRNLAAAPYTVTMDHKSDYFDVDTMFKIQGFNQPSLYVLDTLFSVFVIGSLVVIAWRGVWGIMDLTLYRGEPAKSAWGSLIMGYVTVLVTFTIKPLLRWICSRIEVMLWRLIICDIFYFLTFFGAVNSWRGIWNLLDVYLYPDNKIMSYWITHVIPFLILAALKCSNSILVRGVFIDADGTADECFEIPIHYVKLHFDRERCKKNSYDKLMHEKQSHCISGMESGRAQKDREANEQLLEKPPKKAPIIVSGLAAARQTTTVGEGDSTAATTHFV